MAEPSNWQQAIAPPPEVVCPFCGTSNRPGQSPMIGYDLHGYQCDSCGKKWRWRVAPASGHSRQTEE